MEIAIVLTAALMLSSLLAVKYLQLQDDERIADTGREIGRIQTAIADYAASHKTQSYIIFNAAAAVSVVWRVPGDRPYLPCPDITGDGYEDRWPLPDANTVLTVNTELHQLPLQNSGACYALRGLVPWNTLDTRPTDPWGQRYSYRVDRDFSHGLIGFGERSRADQANDAMPLTVIAMGTEIVTVAATPATVAVSARVFRPVAAISQTVAAMLDVVGVSVMAGVTTTHTVQLPGSYVAEPSLVCPSAPCPPVDEITVTVMGVTSSLTLSPLPLLAGDMYVGASPITVSYDSDVDWPGEIRAVYEQGAVLRGMAVVVLSHGKNGSGGVRGDSAPGMVCNPIPEGNSDERQNAFRDVALNFFAFGGVYNCPVTSPRFGIAELGGANGFVSRPRGTGGQGPGGQVLQEFDDIVRWMSADDLKNEMRKRAVYPINKLPPVGLEDW